MQTYINIKAVQFLGDTLYFNSQKQLDCFYTNLGASC